MEIQGYKRKILKLGLMEIEEASIAITPEELRKFGQFILDCAEKIENNEDFDHEHYRDRFPEYISGSDFIVLHPKYALEKNK